MRTMGHHVAQCSHNNTKCSKFTFILLIFYFAFILLSFYFYFLIYFTFILFLWNSFIFLIFLFSNFFLLSFFTCYFYFMPCSFLTYIITNKCYFPIRMLGHHTYVHVCVYIKLDILLAVNFTMLWCNIPILIGRLWLGN